MELVPIAWVVLAKNRNLLTKYFTFLSQLVKFVTQIYAELHPILWRLHDNFNKKQYNFQFFFKITEI